MNNEGFKPDWVSPPGDTIQRIIEKREISVVELAEELGLSLHNIQRLLSGTYRIDDCLAGKLSDVLGGSKNFWIKRDKHFVSDCKRLGRSDYK